MQFQEVLPGVPINAVSGSGAASNSTSALKANDSVGKCSPPTSGPYAAPVHPRGSDNESFRDGKDSKATQPHMNRNRRAGVQLDVRRLCLDGHGDSAARAVFYPTEWQIGT